MQQLVRVVRDIGLAASLKFRYVYDCRSIVNSIILLESGFWDNLGVRTIEETLKRNRPTLAQQKNPPSCPSDEKIWDSHV